ncbi:uracil-DNA glycosylase family protein [Sphingomicrobium aestuariivivum]|nr:uracil-DNA glycosylase family protein [Sphingomicrobium aestuariivivum]
MPGTLGDIEQWLAARSEKLDARHLPAVIPEGAPLLVIGARGDGEDGLLPPARVLFDRMMAAIGIEAPPLAMIDPAFRPGQPARAPFDPMLVEAMRRRIALAKPERLLILGDQAARALLDAPLLKARGKAQMVEGVRCVATFHPRWLLDRPGDKRMAWQDLQILTGDE